MIVRIVKMGFEAVNINTFLNHFETNKHDIRAFDGCHLLELYSDVNDPTVYFTYSYWDNETALEHYRQSVLFKTLWAKTKPLFNRKPEAWSVNKVATLP